MTPPKKLSPGSLFNPNREPGFYIVFFRFRNLKSEENHTFLPSALDIGFAIQYNYNTGVV